MALQKYISPLIASQFPSFYREAGPNFIAFVEAYYQWMEQSGQVTWEARSMPEYIDVDTTLQKFIKYFKNKYIQSLPSNIAADQQLLMKHIIDLYKSKGTDRGYRLLFRLLYNEDIDIYVPAEHIFKPSDANWYVPNYIEVSDTPGLYSLVSKKIRSSGGATAIVNSYFKKIVGGSTVNILYLSAINGMFHYNELIFCDSLPDITFDNAPIVIGSLSTITILDGGINFSAGDILDISGTGEGALAKVKTTRDENGKVTFTLIDGGFGFSRDAVITVTGGGGSGATFSIGNIINTIVLTLNTDIISGLVDTLIEDVTSAYGLKVNITGATGTFTNGEKASSSANVKHMSVNNLYGQVLSGEKLSNTAIGVDNLVVYTADYTTLYITGTDTNLNNSNLTIGAVLSSNTSGSIVQLNYLSPKTTITGNGIVNSSSSDTSQLHLYNSAGIEIGYYVPGATVTGLTSGKTATVSSVERLTNWGPGYFTKAASDYVNLGSIIDTTLTNIVKEVGTITYLSNISPGQGYSQDPTVDILEPLVYDLRISDNNNKYWGYDATVTGKSGNAKGIINSVEVVDSGLSYENNSPVNLSKSGNQYTATGVGIVDSQGVGTGYWKNNKSFVSDTMYVQDDYYYQSFSYEIGSTKMLEFYEKAVKDLVHPSGTALFGRFRISKDVLDSGSNIQTSSLSQT
jgi:hypothetical protein